MTKDCYQRAEPDEPMFVLLARDPNAAVLVNLWAAMQRMKPDSDVQKILEAEQCANNMVGYFTSKNPDAEFAGMRTATAALCVLAEMTGSVVTIDQEPLEPLAMGHYRHRMSVREHKRAREARESAERALETMIAGGVSAAPAVPGAAS